MIEPGEASSPAVPAGPPAEAATRGGIPSPPRGDGSALPRVDEPAAPLPKVDGVNAPGSPSQVAATTPGTPGGAVDPNRMLLQVRHQTPVNLGGVARRKEATTPYLWPLRCNSAENLHQLLQYSADPGSREAVPTEEKSGGRRRLRDGVLR